MYPQQGAGSSERIVIQDMTPGVYDIEVQSQSPFEKNIKGNLYNTGKGKRYFLCKRGPAGQFLCTAYSLCKRLRREYKDFLAGRSDTGQYPGGF